MPLAAPPRLLLTADAVGGVWRYALELARGLSETGTQIVLAVLGPAPDEAQRAEARTVPGLELIETALPLDWTAAAPRELARATEGLARLAEGCGVDSVHLHAPALVGEAAWGRPVVAVAHSCLATWWRAVRGGPVPRDFAWRVEATGRGLRRADAVVAPSQAFADALRDAYGLTRKMAVIHNGRRPMRVPPGRRVRAVLTAGRLWDEGKNVAALDRVAGHLDAPVLAAGSLSGPNGAFVRFGNLRALGPLNETELAARYGVESVFASTARYEPFGLAVLEAAQAGMALVLSDIPTFRELWDGAAILVDPEDGTALEAALRRALDEHIVRGTAARRHAARFIPERMAARTAALHNALLGARQRETA